jgi:hypothetical protein
MKKTLIKKGTIIENMFKIKHTVNKDFKAEIVNDILDARQKYLTPNLKVLPPTFIGLGEGQTFYIAVK